jgi:ABC-type multidrug transport system fused ATPase/permease subunit
LKKHFFSTSLILALFFALLQQLIVAFSIISIVRLGQEVAQGHSFFIWLVLFLVSLTIVYLPSTLSNYFRIKAEFHTFDSFINRFKDKFYGKTSHLNDKILKEKVHSYITNESWNVAKESIFFFVDAFQLFTNILFSIFVFGYVVDPMILIGYLLTLPLIYLGLKLSANRISNASLKAQETNTSLAQHLKSSWDTFFIGNKYNLTLWKNKYDSSLKQALSAGTKSTLTIEIGATIVLLISLVPLFLITVWLFISNKSDIVLLSGLVVTLPRQVQTIQNLSDFVTLFSFWKGLKAKLQGLFSASELPSHKNLVSLVQWEDLTFAQNNKIVTFNDYTSLHNELLKDSCGRYTIRGSNSSGKSTLLALLKEDFGNQVQLIPAHNDLIFKNIDGQQYSTGQRIKLILKEISEFSEPFTLFIDEWDANLDDKSISELDQLIEDITQNNLVVEIRHRGSASK